MKVAATILLTLLGLPLAASAVSTLPPAAAGPVDFKKDVQPLLAAKCYGCHGPSQAQSGLRLDKRQNALRGGDYGPVIVAGKSAESKLILRVANGDGGLQMPPTGALSMEEIGVLRKWIDQGAEFADVEVHDAPPPKPVNPKLRQLISALREQRDADARKMIAATPALVKAADAAGSSPLHHAAGFGTLVAMRALLAAGADPNAANSLGSRPLHWALPDEAKTRLLIESGVDVNAKTNDGRTPLYHVASLPDSNAALNLLLEKGAAVGIATLNGRTPLMAASGVGNVEAMRALLAKGADPKAANSARSTALMDAAGSRNAAAVRLLVERGADVNAATKRNLTPLSVAAMMGSEEIVRVLLDRGAQVNIQDERGYSPLMYAAYCETMPSGIIRLLLAKGARADATGEGETPRSLAAKRGDTEVARLLGAPPAERATAAPPAALDRPIPEAVTLALNILERQSPRFVKTGGCNSCHNQSLPSAAIALARDHGIAAPKSIMELSNEMMERSADRTMDNGVVGVNSVGYEMFGVIARHVPSSDYTDAMVRYIKSMQYADGRWATTNSRPPLTSDDVLTTAMAIRTLRTYTPAPQKADTDRRVARAAKWLEATSAATTQEHAFRVLGLVWAGADAASIDRAVRGLAATQRPDGGWAQLPAMASDAYATGEAVFALGVAGKRAADEAVYQKGIAYLRATQANDGSWHVRTRSLPLQPYFESGFPYAHDQWISAAGTSWAAMALTLAVEPQRLSQR